MRLDADTRNLEREWERETAILRERVTHLADRLEQDVSLAHWVRRHPYFATASAATIGFVAAQAGLEPLIAASRAAFAPAVVPPRPVSTPDASPVPPATWTNILSVLANVAQQFLAPQAVSRPASLVIANAGSVAGSAFPSPDSNPDGKISRNQNV